MLAAKEISAVRLRGGAGLRYSQPDNCVSANSSTESHARHCDGVASRLPRVVRQVVGDCAGSIPTTVGGAADDVRSALMPWATLLQWIPQSTESVEVKSVDRVPAHVFVVVTGSPLHGIESQVRTRLPSRGGVRSRPPGAAGSSGESCRQTCAGIGRRTRGRPVVGGRRARTMGGGGRDSSRTFSVVPSTGALGRAAGSWPTSASTSPRL